MPKSVEAAGVVFRYMVKYYSCSPYFQKLVQYSDFLITLKVITKSRLNFLNLVAYIGGIDFFTYFPQFFGIRHEYL